MADEADVGISLDTLAGGAAAQLFEAELIRVLRNIADPNTLPTVKRSITLEVTITPADDRSFGAVAVACSAKLAPMKPAATRVFFGRYEGRPVATEWDPQQAGLFDDKNKPVVVSMRERGE